MSIVESWFEAADAFLFGRRTYEIFAAYWPLVTDPSNTVAAQLNSRPKYVVTNTLQVAEWPNTRLVRGEVASEIAKLKAQPGRELQVHGCGELAQMLMSHDLVDEYRLCIDPVVLGNGKRLFRDNAVATSLKLLDRRITSTGVTVNTYEPAGRPAYGDFAVDRLGESIRDDFRQGIVDAAAAARGRGK